VDQPYLTLEQIAETLQVTVETVRGYLKHKTHPLPAYRLGREYRVKRVDFDKWIEERRLQQEGT
jgi:excisionase family DNA binding protein